MRRTIVARCLLVAAAASVIQAEHHNAFANSKGRLNVQSAAVSGLRNFLHSPRRASGGRNYGSTSQRQHLDVAVPNQLMNSDSSLLIHLKDQGLWEKENTVGGSNAHAAFMPTYLGSHAQEGNYEPEITPGEVNREFKYSKNAMKPKSIFQDVDMNFGSIPDMNQIVNMDAVTGKRFESKAINVRDAFRDVLHGTTTSSLDSVNPSKSSMSNGPGVFFNLNDLNDQFEHVVENMGEDFDGLDFIVKDGKGGVYVDFLQMLKEQQAAASLQAAVAPSLGQPDLTDPNALLAQELRRKNISFEVSKDGGLLYNL
ncbi:uncharacterized protein LOC108668344 [Hyalella azteca]|uniref:Uncharacterized protein LOC108668344 n=1 Tax=Hyalella azteca TaxID=294128 RepID=A0A8B7NBQ3_HYAAZ|nr:uncharacterized protein LOC108668344 [Hyalella azteca]